MIYPFRQARWYTPGAIREYRAVVIHMAEGGGTVGYLANVARDVSASHVIEYDGTIVQMVADGDASHGQHTSPEPYKTAGFGIYAPSIARAVLGADGWADVNRFVFAIEIEGFRAAGPNAAQIASLRRLIADLRSRYPSIRGLLGHRDIQDKPCPGGLIPWAEIGGHGLSVATQEDEMDPARIIPVATCTVTGPLTVYADPDRKTTLIASWAGATSVGLYGKPANPATVPAPLVPIRINLAGAPALDLRVGWVGWDRVTVTSDCTAAVAAAVDPLNRRIAAIKAKAASFAADVAND